MVGGITKEDTSGRPRGELVWRSSGSVGVTCAAENTQVLIRGCGAEECDMGAGGADRLSGETVQQVRGSTKPLNPIAHGE